MSVYNKSSFTNMQNRRKKVPRSRNTFSHLPILWIHHPVGTETTKESITPPKTNECPPEKGLFQQEIHLNQPLISENMLSFSGDLTKVIGCIFQLAKTYTQHLPDQPFAWYVPNLLSNPCGLELKVWPVSREWGSDGVWETPWKITHGTTHKNGGEGCIQ